MGDISIKGKSKILLKKIADAFKPRGREPSEWMKPKIKPKKRFNLVVISPYFTKPPPIATMAAINAAIPASWSFILNLLAIF